MEIVRGGRLEKGHPEEVARYTSSIKFDSYIVNEVIQINQAHVIALAKAGILAKEEAAKLLETLDKAREEIRLSPELEDVHMALENLVIEKLGIKLGGKIHVAKSRNDQVAAAIRMRLRSWLLQILSKILSLEEKLLEKAERHVGDIMPGYTHLQRAQPITIAHYLLAYYDAFARDFDRIIQCYRRVNLSPLGAAALAGTSFNISREYVAQLLGFDGLVENSVDAVSSRDFALEALSSLAILMVNVSRFAEEVVLWSTSEFNFVDVPEEHASTSSIMPQKKNPVTAEVMRARAGQVLGDLVSSISIMKALPLSYNLDMQELTPHLWSACEKVEETLMVLADLVEKIMFNVERLRDSMKGDFLTATELANMLFRKYGVSFREAHIAVGRVIKELLSVDRAFKASSSEIANLLSKELGIRVEPKDVREALNVKRFITTLKTGGSSSIKSVKNMLRRRRRALMELSKAVKLELEKLRASDDALKKAIAEFLRTS
ncbi:MAG: argininosuccinate lyase [Candidatus Methanomethylicota archaeon]|uniref:Argininosuccinate lyase n=1 Tax=Thermoproteota archaeon TaxID=2056631 RepID=A0A497F0P1_9CREN|nr:MAG: argininosuccinate lyase [Candidatus Verstraetearchaeota archaeon]RLE53017.1 MAG: argininosuccinate lyase [Candidatus Verstraetearchaeota archaeon]